MKTKRSLLIYNKSIGCVGFKWYAYLCCKQKIIYIEVNLIGQFKHCCIEK